MREQNIEERYIQYTQNHMQFYRSILKNEYVNYFISDKSLYFFLSETELKSGINLSNSFGENAITQDINAAYYDNATNSYQTSKGHLLSGIIYLPDTQKPCIAI